MGYHVGEASQFFVSALQFVHQASFLFLGQLALADVPHDADEHIMTAIFHLYHCKVHGKFRVVFSHARHFGWYTPAFKVSHRRITLEIIKMLILHLLLFLTLLLTLFLRLLLRREQYSHILPDYFVFFIAKNPPGGWVE